MLILYKYNVHCFGKILWNIIFNKYHIKSCGWMTLNSLRVVFVLPMYSYFLSWLEHLLVCCLQSFQIISHLSYFPTAVSMVSFTVLNQLLCNQLILWKWSCATTQHDNLSPPPPPPPPKKKLAMICRLFTAPFFSVRLWKSSAYQYGPPSWFHMYQGDRGRGV